MVIPYLKNGGGHCSPAVCVTGHIYIKLLRIVSVFIAYSNFTAVVLRVVVVGGGATAHGAGLGCAATAGAG